MTPAQQQVEDIKDKPPPEILIPPPQACSPLLIRFILSILVKVVEVLPPVVCPNVLIGRFVVRRRRLKASRWEFFFFSFSLVILTVVTASFLHAATR